MHKPLLNQKLFWDTAFNNINYDKSFRSIIERVFERGDVEDLREVRRYYGDEKIVETLTSAKWLRYDIFIFCKNLFNLKAEDFRCYTSRQLSQIPWHY